jgi:hypothetical protein
MDIGFRLTSDRDTAKSLHFGMQESVVKAIHLLRLSDGVLDILGIDEPSLPVRPSSDLQLRLMKTLQDSKIIKVG